MKQYNLGYIHSIETMGLVDGPGVRFVVFMQGCPLRCLYCHNPDTWATNSGLEMTPSELVSKIVRYKSYFADKGGVTFSGGEPLLQSEFLLECLKLCKKENIHTCLDTCGVGGNINDEILDYTDLILYDIKAIKSDSYTEMTGAKINKSLEFLELAQKKKISLWIRSVIIPTLNDTIEYMNELYEFLKDVKHIERIELLPYETYGVYKYKELGIRYRLDGIEAMDKNECEKLQNYLLEKRK